MWCVVVLHRDGCQKDIGVVVGDEVVMRRLVVVGQDLWSRCNGYFGEKSESR
jgi:hypothetical protein